MSKNDRQAQKPSVPVKVSEPTAEGKIYTYIGQGEEPPRKINFMGAQEFVRGKATEVVDQRVLGKLQGHPCFVEGEVTMEDLHSQDEDASKVADEQRAEDRKINALFHKKHKTE